VVVQPRPFFTALFAILLIGDKPTGQQLAAFAGLLMIGLILGTNIPAIAFAFTLASAATFL
jgi:drug/metabolite transporter (DMT)-like permease